MTQHIDKAAVVAEIEKRKNENLECETKAGRGYFSARAMEDIDILSCLDTLEVKEVDFEKEIKEEYLKHRCYGGRDNMLVILNEPQFNKIAKHFFELGLKTKKEE